MTEDDETVRAFKQAVNMTPSALEKWLATEESGQVGFTHEGDSESVGHRSGGRIIELLRKKKSDFSSSDHDHMRKVIGYVHRHLAQRPSGDIEHSKWRYSLMNWGHDPLKSD